MTTRSRELKIAIWVAALLLAVLAFPVVWSIDRLLEARCLLFVNLLTAVAVPIGWPAAGRLRRPDR